LKINQQKIIAYGLIGVTFLVMFGLNCLTPWLADDFNYAELSHGFFYDSKNV
jgi:hypothetical protein